jgi:hypothetical protein
MERMQSLDLQQRAARGGLFDSESAFGINRPASAQGRFVNTSQNSRYGAPPGLKEPKQQDILQDPAMLQALQTLSSAGNLTPQQIQQIQMQLALNSRPLAPSNQWDKKSHNRAQPVPTRGYASANTSPQQKNRAEPMMSRSADHSPIMDNAESPTRSALLEEFRTNKNRKYELRVFFAYLRILLEAL